MQNFEQKLVQIINSNGQINDAEQIHYSQKNEDEQQPNSMQQKNEGEIPHSLASSLEINTVEDYFSIYSDSSAVSESLSSHSLRQPISSASQGLLTAKHIEALEVYEQYLKYKADSETLLVLDSVTPAEPPDDYTQSQLDKTLFPRYPTYKNYIAWRERVQHLLARSTVKNHEQLYEMLAGCFKGGIPLTIYRNTYLHTEDNPKYRLTHLFKSLDSAYSSQYQKSQQWKKVENFIPKGNGHQIAKNFLSIYNPTKDLIEINAHIFALHHKFPPFIQNKIMTRCINGFPNTVPAYLDIITVTKKSALYRTLIVAFVR